MFFSKFYTWLFSSTLPLLLCGICSFPSGQLRAAQADQQPIAASIPATSASATAVPEICPKPITTVVCDLGGVLFDTSRSGMSGELGYGDFILYTLSFKNPANIQKIAFSILDQICGAQVPEEGSDFASADGRAMPGIMCKWMCGALSGKEIIELVNREIDSGNYNRLFSNSVEKRLVKKIVGAIFDPKIMAKHTHPIKQGLEILEACAQRDDLSLMVLSNYGADAFEELYNKEEAQKVFRYFAPEKIVVSGFISTMKPYHSIYEYIKKQYHLDPAACLIIDDQKENIDAAKKEGFETIWVKKGNFAAVRKRLVKLHVLAK